MGLGDMEIVALSGAHTLGRAKPSRSGFGKEETKYTKDGPGTPGASDLPSRVGPHTCLPACSHTRKCAHAASCCHADWFHHVLLREVHSNSCAAGVLGACFVAPQAEDE